MRHKAKKMKAILHNSSLKPQVVTGEKAQAQSSAMVLDAARERRSLGFRTLMGLNAGRKGSPKDGLEHHEQLRSEWPL